MKATTNADELERRAGELLSWNRPRAARRSLASALAVDPTHVGALSAATSMDVVSGRLDSEVALSRMDALAKEHPESSSVRQSTARVLHWSGHHLG